MCNFPCCFGWRAAGSSLEADSPGRDATLSSRAVTVDFDTLESVSEDIWTALNIEVLRADEGESDAGMQGRGKREIPEKTCRPAASSGTIPTCEDPEAAPPGNEPGSPWWEASRPILVNASAPRPATSFVFPQKQLTVANVDCSPRFLYSCCSPPPSSAIILPPMMMDSSTHTKREAACELPLAQPAGEPTALFAFDNGASNKAEATFPARRIITNAFRRSRRTVFLRHVFAMFQAEKQRSASAVVTGAPIPATTLPFRALHAIPTPARQIPAGRQLLGGKTFSLAEQCNHTDYTETGGEGIFSQFNCTDRCTTQPAATARRRYMPSKPVPTWCGGLSNVNVPTRYWLLKTTEWALIVIGYYVLRKMSSQYDDIIIIITAKHNKTPTLKPLSHLMASSRDVVTYSFVLFCGRCPIGRDSYWPRCRLASKFPGADWLTPFPHVGGRCPHVSRLLFIHSPLCARGATVAERLGRSPPTGFNPPPGHSGPSLVGIVPNDAVGRRVFSESPVSTAPSFRRLHRISSGVAKGDQAGVTLIKMQRQIKPRAVLIHVYNAEESIPSPKDKTNFARCGENPVNSRWRVLTPLLQERRRGVTYSLRMWRYLIGSPPPPPLTDGHAFELTELHAGSRATSPPPRPRMRLPTAAGIAAMRYLMHVPLSTLAFARSCAMSRQVGGPLKQGFQKCSVYREQPLPSFFLAKSPEAHVRDLHHIPCDKRHTCAPAGGNSTSTGLEEEKLLSPCNPLNALCLCEGLGAKDSKLAFPPPASLFPHTLRAAAPCGFHCLQAAPASRLRSALTGLPTKPAAANFKWGINASLVGFTPSRTFKPRTPHSPPSRNPHPSTVHFARAQTVRRPPSKTAGRWVAANLPQLGGCVAKGRGASQSHQNILASSLNVLETLAGERRSVTPASIAAVCTHEIPRGEAKSSERIVPRKGGGGELGLLPRSGAAESAPAAALSIAGPGAGKEIGHSVANSSGIPLLIATFKPWGDKAAKSDKHR
ncbi:hypothetical protein PR048_016868 [Dryococelus australis]|uniref:Uncharacterized protein n=1 Tax=Dryococelus australis TaxID=614101 RepID=A0ABQ9H7W0_9NEOP|nr:hypothetical protein PR048_016868 [Dryococelus australis]